MNIKKKIVLIGASTGGPGHLKKILQSLKHQSNVLYVIAQHMSSSHMSSFVAQMNSITKMPVLQTAPKTELFLSHIYICSKNVEFYALQKKLYLHEVDKKTSYEPSIDLLFNSASSLVKEYEVISIVLTGIGDDGAKGSLTLYNAGAFLSIAESEESAIVYGMPRQTKLSNSNTKVLSLKNIIVYLQSL